MTDTITIKEAENYMNVYITNTNHAWIFPVPKKNNVEVSTCASENSRVALAHIT